MPFAENMIKKNCFEYLMIYCAEMIDAYDKGLSITPDSDLTRDLKMNREQLKALAAEIERKYGVEVSYNRFYLKGQLNTLYLITEYIYMLKHFQD